MKGETALLCPKIIKAPIKTSITTIGVNHQALRTLRKLQASPNNDLLLLMLLRINYPFNNVMESLYLI